MHPGEVAIDLDGVDGFDLAPGERCTVTVELTRRRAGSLDAGFPAGGSIEGLQVRQVTVDVIR